MTDDFSGLGLSTKVTDAVLAAGYTKPTDIQAQAFQDVPYLPVGQYFQPWAYRRGVSGVLKGIPMFWSVQRA